MNDNEDDVTIMISRNVYVKTEKRVKAAHGPMGESAGYMSAEAYIERVIEVALKDQQLPR